MHNLVNKFLREKFSNEEKKIFQQENVLQEQGNRTPEIIDENFDAASLVKDEIYHERSLTRCLIEFGLKEW